MSDIYGNIPDGLTKIDTEVLKEAGKKDEKRVFLFISFDMVNSTALKTKKQKEWPSIVTYFYETIAKEIKDIIIDSEIWKYLGDEIIFYYIIKNVDRLYDIPEYVYKIQEKVVLKIAEIFGVGKIVDIKCTMWLAGVRYLNPGSISDIEKMLEGCNDIYRNINVSINSGEKTIEDFLGPDIDIGFRIAKYATKSKVTLSAEYAYLLYCLGKPDGSKKIDNRLKIVSFQELKGVWDGRAYPIIWYHPDWDNGDDVFDYDEHINNEIIKEIDKKKDIEFLEKVFNETDKMDYVKKFIAICNTYNEKDDKTQASVIKDV